GIPVHERQIGQARLSSWRAQTGDDAEPVTPNLLFITSLQTIHAFFSAKALSSVLPAWNKPLCGASYEADVTIGSSHYGHVAISASRLSPGSKVPSRGPGHTGPAFAYHAGTAS